MIKIGNRRNINLMNKNKNSKKDESQLKWFIIIFVTTFILSILFSFISTVSINGLDIIPAIIILILVIFIGIIFCNP